MKKPLLMLGLALVLLTGAPAHAETFFNTNENTTVADSSNGSVSCPNGTNAECSSIGDGDWTCNVSTHACVPPGGPKGAGASCTADGECQTGLVCNPTSSTCAAPKATEPGAKNNPSPAASSGGTLVNPLGVNSLPDLLHAVLAGVVQIGSILLVLALVWVGFLFVFAQGNPERITSARTALLWTVVGGILLLGAQAIATVIQATVTGLS